MNRSLRIGRFVGTEIRLHISLLLLIPYALIAFKPEGLTDTVRVLALIVAIFVCVALHEMGHTLAAHLAGIQVSSIVLWPLGGFTNLTRRPQNLLADMAISAAGPLTNLILFAGLAGVIVIERLVEQSMLFPGVSRFLYNADIFAGLMGLTIANLSLALFNLAPVYPLDGGQIARGLLKSVIGEKYADWIMLLFSLPLALALTGLGFAIRDIAIILTGLVLLLASLSLNNHIAEGMTLLGLYFIDRGGYYLRRQDLDSAVAEYSRAIQRSPTRAGLYASRAVAYMELGEYTAARNDVEQTLQLDANRFTAWTLRGELLALEGNLPGAAFSIQQSIQLHPNWGPASLIQARIHAMQGDLPQAFADLDQAIEMGQGAPAGYILRSMLRDQVGDRTGAAADADQAQRYAPDWGLVFPENFLVNFQGRLSWALDYYWRAMQRMPGAYQCLQGRADACRVNHRPDWAIIDYTRAIQIAPHQAELFLSRGKTYLETGSRIQAMDDFRQASHLARQPHLRRKAQQMINALLSTASVPGEIAAIGSTLAAVETSKSTPASD
jgi:Zn-dependent protease/Tfp pilus assembly protein PilF